MFATALANLGNFSQPTISLNLEEYPPLYKLGHWECGLLHTCNFVFF